MTVEDDGETQIPQQNKDNSKQFSYRAPRNVDVFIILHECLRHESRRLVAFVFLVYQIVTSRYQ
jgi:hypothetical protein